MEDRSIDTIRLGNAYDDGKYTGGNFGGNVWDLNGLAPTMKTGASASQQCTVEIKNLTSKEGEARCLRAEQSRAEQSRAEQHSPCPSSNEGRIYSLPGSRDCRSELSGQQNTQRKGSREWRDMSDSDNGEYP